MYGLTANIPGNAFAQNQGAKVQAPSKEVSNS
jgi:hypothetical protein